MGTITSRSPCASIPSHPARILEFQDEQNFNFAPSHRLKHSFRENITGNIFDSLSVCATWILSYGHVSLLSTVFRSVRELLGEHRQMSACQRDPAERKVLLSAFDFRFSASVSARMPSMRIGVEFPHNYGVSIKLRSASRSRRRKTPVARRVELPPRRPTTFLLFAHISDRFLTRSGSFRKPPPARFGFAISL